MRLLFIVLDGAADEIKYGDTPLEKAKTKNMDWIASRSKNGFLYPLGKQIAPESDQATLALLGFNPFKIYTGRGILEAFGANIPIKKGSIVIRGNFAFLENGIIKNAGVKLDKHENESLCKMLNSKIGIKNVKFYSTKEHRFVLALENKKLSDRIQNTHPGYKVVKNYVTTATKKRIYAKPEKCVPLVKNSSAIKTASLVNQITKKASKILKNKKVNYILLRGASSKLPKLKKLSDFGILADSHVDIAIGKLSGMQVLPKPEDNKDLAKVVIENYEKFDKLYVQIKSPDKFSHKRDYKGKIKALEDIDKNFLGYLRNKINLENLTIVLTCDHATSSRLGVHIKNPVPFAITSKIPDSVERFGERFCKKGSLGEIFGKDVAKIIKENLKN